MIIVQANKEVEIKNWPMAEPLFAKWGYDTVDKEKIIVHNIDDIVSELSAWGITWKRLNWNC